jgi:hypothetical protein
MTKDEIIDEFKRLSRERRKLRQIENDLKSRLMFFARFKVGQQIEYVSRYGTSQIRTAGTVTWVRILGLGEFRYNIVTNNNEIIADILESELS